EPEAPAGETQSVADGETHVESGGENKVESDPETNTETGSGETPTPRQRRRLPGLKQILASSGAGLRSGWGRVRAPFRYIRNFYEPWMLSSLLLLGSGALIYAFWVFNWRPELDDLRRLTLPFVLGATGLGVVATIAWGFLQPSARNPLTAPLFLRRLYRPWMLPAVSLLAIAALIYGFWKVGARNPAAIQPKSKPDDSISLRFEDVELRGRKQGTPFFTIMADKVEVSRDSSTVRFLKGKNKTKPHGEFYNLKDWEEDATGALPRRRAITWESNEAIFNTQDQNLSMKGDVRIKTDVGDTILTEEMLWNRNAETLTSNTRTRVHTHKDTYLQSNKLKVETRTKALFLDGQVFIDMKIGEDKIVDVEELEN
ncbi:MAG TPA: LPS export ABC transporter periplasmic protein LptC, partial [Candidatus Obscuribacterales bacterium]